MGMKFLNKKGWHPATFRNQERVWKAEQKHKEEETKMAELQKQVREEREREEFRELQIRAGVKPQQERLDFLYESGLGVGKPSEAAPPSTEEYLLGKPVEEASKTETISKDFSQPGSLFQQADDPASKNDAWRKLHSDPLLAIKQQEQAALAKIKENPMQMMMIKQQAADKKAQKKEEKRRAKEERRAERKRKREERKKRRRADSSESDSESESEDEKSSKPPPEKKRAPVLEEAPAGGGRNGHSHGGFIDKERDLVTTHRGDELGTDSRHRGRSPVRVNGREEEYRDREGARYGDRMLERNRRDVLPRGRREELGRSYGGRYGRGYSPERHRRSPDRFRNGGAHHQGGRDDRERSLDRNRNGGRHSRGGRSPRRDGRERSPEDPRKRQQHDSSDEEAEKRQPVRSAGEKRGRNGEREKGEERGPHTEKRRDEFSRKDDEELRANQDRKRHDTPESDEERSGEEGKRKAQRGSELRESSGRNGDDRTAVKDEPQRSDSSEGARDVRVKKEDASDGEEGAERPEPGPVSGMVKKEEAEDSDDEPGKLKGYGLIPGRGGLQLPAKRTGDAPPVPYKKPEEPAKAPPRVRHVPGKLTEEEKARRLAEMQQDANVHEASRVHRLKRAAEKEDRDDAAAAKAAAGKSYLGGLEKSAYGLEKGGSVEDSIRRRTHFREKGPAASNANAFRR